MIARTAHMRLMEAVKTMFGRSRTFTPTHRHSKGGLYQELHRGVLEADETPVVIYGDADGQVWVRPVAEFDDGRFTRL